MAKDVAMEKNEGRLMFGGMARWDGLDLFGPNYTSVAYRRKGEIHVKIEPSVLRKLTNPSVQRVSRWPVIRSFYLWGRVFAQVFGSIWSLVFFTATLAVLWLFGRIDEDSAPLEIYTKTVLLAFPASMAAAAGRLAV